MSRTFPLLALALFVPATGQAQDLMAPPPSRSVAVPSDAGLSATMDQWNTLRQSEMLPFASYARFMVAHPGWPGEAVIRRAAERAIRPGGEDAGLIVQFFDRFPPATATATLRQAEALDAIGRRDDGRLTARRAWTLGALSPDDEARLLTRFGTALLPADQDSRMERLLWARATPAAQRQLAATAPVRQPVFGTRVALQARSPDAASRLALVADGARGDAGLMADRVAWLRATGQEASARALLASPRQLNAPPLDAQRWLDQLFAVADSAAKAGQTQLAYDIARQVDDTYAPSTVVRDRPIGERDDYTNLTWLAGTLALDRLSRPADAVAMFDRYARAARSPQTQTKGLYWAGRAAQAAGRASDANRYFEAAAAFFDQFYGQLSAERLGRAPSIPPVTATLEVSKNQREAFFGSEIVRAAQLTGARGDHATQTLFVRQIAQAAQSDVDHLLAAELATRIGRPDLGVMVGRSAGINGLRDYVRVGFPTVPVPAEANANWSLVHAIMRQESQFDRMALSRAGARGLMQLMPATARATSVRIGATFDQPALLTDTQYNIRLGSTYIAQRLDNFGGSYVLAVAAYNAGAGNVNKWLAANGDPRNPGVDVLRWIEAIPFSETRAYVQRVLENAVVYDLLDPSRARVRTATPLSTYLGKRTPG